MSVGKLDRGRKGWYFSCRINGKQYKKEKWNNKKMLTKTEALAAEHQFKQQMITPDASNITIYQLYDEYLATSKSNIKQSSYRNYTSFRENKLILIPDKKIFDLKNIDIVNWKKRIIECDNSITFTNKNLKIIKRLLEYGSMMYNLPSNLQSCLLEPLKDYSIQTIEEKTKWLKKEEFYKMIDKLDSTIDNEYYYKVCLIVLYETGLRIGEFAALTIDDIKPYYISVNKGVVKVNDNYIVSSPKTKNSIRNVYISKELYDIIINYNTRLHPAGTLFHLESEYLNEQRLRRVLHQLAKITGMDLTHEIKVHNLRHSRNCNLKYIYGLNEVECAALLGHTPKVSTEVYSHADIEKIKEKIK